MYIVIYSTVFTVHVYFQPRYFCQIWPTDKYFPIILFCDALKCTEWKLTGRNKYKNNLLSCIFKKTISKSSNRTCLFSLKSPNNIIKCLRTDKWSESKVKEIALSILSNHLICIDSVLCSISRSLSTFQLQPALYASFGVAWCFHYGVSHILLVYLNAISKHPALHLLLLHFTSILFVDIITFAQYPVCQEYFYFKYAEMKVEALEVHFVIEVPDASPWIPIARLWCLLLDANSSSCVCCCRSSKVRQGPLRTAHFLRGYPYVALVHYHFCQLSLLCKQALIFKEASPLLSTVQNRVVTGAQGIVLQRAGQPKDFLYKCSCLAKCWSALH